MIWRRVPGGRYCIRRSRGGMGCYWRLLLVTFTPCSDLCAVVLLNTPALNQHKLEFCNIL